MNTIQMLFLERPLAVYVALFFAEAICLLVLWRLRSRRALIAAVVPVVLGIGVYALSSLVVTDREMLWTAVESLRHSVLDGDGSAIAAWVDESYDDRLHNKDSAVRMAQGAKELGLESVRWSGVAGLDLGLQDGKAHITNLKQTVLIHQLAGPAAVETIWQLWWVRRPQGWRLVSARLDYPDLRGAPRGPAREAP